MSKFCCLKCNYFTDKNGLLKQHLSTKKHLNIASKDKVTISPYKCNKCEKGYETNSGLKKHNQVCKVVAVILPKVLPLDLHAEIVNLKGLIIELSKNLQPTSVINNNNINNNNNYINIFLNDKCHNACDIKRFIAGIDFSKENFEKLIRDYVGGNAEIITKNYNSLPEYERPVYVFNGEDEHQKVAHIQYDNKWVVERELGWEKQVRREYNDGNDDPIPNSMYSLIRLFDKKKMEYFDNNYRQSHLYLSQRKFNKDCLDDGKQLELINKIIDMVSIDTEL
jgi:hypothetical protein